MFIIGLLSMNLQYVGDDVLLSLSLSQVDMGKDAKHCFCNASDLLAVVD